MNIALPKRIAIIYSDAKRKYFPTEEQYQSEAEVYPRAKLIAKHFNQLKVSTKLIPGNAQLVENLKKFNPTFALNLVDSVYGDESLSTAIPATLELLGIPYTGAGIEGFSIATNKYFTKILLQKWGITTPKYQLIKEISEEIDPFLDYPLIVKLNTIHGGVEMNEHSVCQNEKELRTRISYLMKTYKQPILVEEYIAGKEISVIVTKGLNIKTYAVEKVFSKDIGLYEITTFQANWIDTDLYSYEKYQLPSQVKEDIKIAFDILKMDDYAKFDLRVDQAGRHYFIDCNANTSLGPKNHSPIGTILALYDISFNDFLRRLITNTLAD